MANRGSRGHPANEQVPRLACPSAQVRSRSSASEDKTYRGCAIRGPLRSSGPLNTRSRRRMGFLATTIELLSYSKMRGERRDGNGEEARRREMCVAEMQG